MSDSSELEVRASIVTFIKQYMDSPEKVTAQTQSDCAVIMEFIADGLDRGPQEFLSSDPPLPVEHKFLVWLVPSLLRVVVYPHAGQLESKITECVQKLLQFLRNKTSELFELFLAELFAFIRDLFTVNARSVATRVPYPLYLRHFNIPFINSDEQRAATDKIPEPPTIELTGPAQTKKLLVVSLKLLKSFVLEICNFLESQQVVLWQMLCDLIKGPSLELKKGALMFVEELLVCQASLPPDLCGQLCWCLVKLLHKLSDLTDEQRAILEPPLVACLTALFTPSWSETSLAPMKYWELLSTALVSVILSHLYAVCSTVLQECIGQLLGQCLVLEVVYPHTIVDIINSWIGHTQNLRPFITVTTQVIYTELVSTANSMEFVQQISNEHDGPPRLKRHKRDLPYDLSYRRRRMKLPRRERMLAEHYPLTAAVMHCFRLCARKLDSAASSTGYSIADGNKLLLLLDGMSFLVEVFGRCSEVENMSLDQWLGSGVLDQTVKLMEDCVQLSSHSSYPPDIRERVLLSVLDCTGLVLSVIVSDGLSAVMIDRCCWLISLAWAKSPTSMDLVAGSNLTPKQRKEARQAYSSIKPTAAAVKSLFVLGSIPAMSSDIVIKFYYKEALCHPASEVLTAAISILPCLLVIVDARNVSVLLDSVMAVTSERWSQEACLQLANRLPALAAVVCCSAVSKIWDTSSNQLLYQTCAVHLPNSPQQVDTIKLPVFQQIWKKLLDMSSPHVLTEVVENLVESLHFTDDVQSLEVLFIQLLDHSDKIVIETVYSHIQVLLPKSDPPNIQKWPLLLKLKQLATSSMPWQRELAARLSGKLGMEAKRPLLSHCVMLLLELIMSGQEFIKAVVHVQVRLIAAFHNLVPTKLLVSLKESICEFLMAALRQQPDIVYGRADETDLCSEIAMAFEYSTIRHFFQSIADVLVPLLSVEATDIASAFLDYIAKALSKSSQELLLHNFQYIFAYLVCHCTESRRKSHFIFLKDVMKVDLKSIVRSVVNHILNQLLLNLGRHNKRVRAGLTFVIKVIDGKSQDVSSDKNLAMFLQNEHRLLGILAFFHARLARGAVETGKLALSSLIELMKLMGSKHLTPVRATVMTILRLSHKFKTDEVLELFCMAWGCFVRNIDIGCVGPLLSEVVVSLTPFVDQFPEVISDVFEFLIVKNEKTLSPYFHEVYSMPDSPSLESVNAMLEKHSVESLNSSEPVFQQKLRHTLKGIHHERHDVRRFALKTLQSHLKSNKDDLINLILSSDVTDPVITEIVTAILKGLKDSDTELYQMYGKCLGVLGAVDPGRLKLPIVMSKKQDQVIEVEGKSSSEFVIELVSLLGKTFLGAVDAVVQDCCAFAIQDVLKVYECDNPEPTSDGAKLWAKFPDNTREMLSQYLHTKYFANNYPKFSNLGPVFTAAANMTFKDWIQKWTCQLIGTLNESLTKRVFKDCTLIFKYNVGLALFLLPYVLLCALQQGGEDISQAIHGEVMAVLNFCIPSDELRMEVTETTNMCAQALFTGLDYLQSWLGYKVSLAATIKATSGESRLIEQQQVDTVDSFLDSISKDLLARAAYSCRAYARALRYLEDFLSTSEESIIQQNLGFLQQIYDALNDSDGVAGVAAIRASESSLQEQILQYESTGAFHDAADCYTKAIQQDRAALDFHEGLLRCLMKFGDFTTAQMNVRGLLAERPEWHYAFNSYQIEAAWRLGDWDMLDHSLEQEPLCNSSWEVGLGRVLLAAKKGDKEMFRENLDYVRGSLMWPLATASLELGSYQRGYEYIVRLHMLQEVDEVITKFVFGPEDQPKRTLEKMLMSWNNRLKLTQESFKTKVSILNLRRVLLELVREKQRVGDNVLRNEIGQFWLMSAKFARRAGYLQTAHSSLLHASDYSLSEFCIEHAEWKCNQADTHQALMSLQKVVNENWPLDDDDITDIDSNSTHAKALLMMARWMEDTELDSATIIKHYKRAIAVNNEFEDGHFFLGRYYDKLMCALSRDQPAKYGDSAMQFTIQHYGSALRHGNDHIYHCMPRVMSLWLDYSNKQLGVVSKPSEQVLSKLTTQVDTLVEQLPPYQFLIAFSQLISRVCHPNPDVFKTLERIILKLLEHYPQQALWMMIAVSKSTHQDRQTRCRSIFDKAKKSKPHLSKLIGDMTRLCDKLQELSKKHVESGKTTTMDKLCRGLARLTNDRDFSPIMVPLQSSLTVTLPSDSSSHLQHNPFPGVQPTIVRFHDKVEILTSLQKPKKVFIVASDGKLYPMMCKPKDDLRKDCRLMEFNSVINKFLHKDPECRQRQLYVRTYAVVPLNEDCGMLEWVENTTGLRPILLKLYKEKGMYMSGHKLKSIMQIPGREHSKLKDAFLNKLLPAHPPVFGEWFMKTFPDPTTWYSSRRCYARTTAVMSMVGYILGLGDRHGENVMCDSITGDTVHVDFDCLFNKGSTFDWPEVVPFRLTQNMIHAMGVTGYEGVFRNSCETTMRVMREQHDPLMCVLKTFIHDPLVEWEKEKGKVASGSKSPTEKTKLYNEKALKIVGDIEDRLQGKHTKGLPLSVKGQVHVLIKEATDPDNLCKMYVGWMAYL